MSRPLELQMRISPNSKRNARPESVIENARPKKKSRISAVARPRAQELPLSTNISSPIRGGSKARAPRKAPIIDDEESEEDDNNDYAQNPTRNGYARDKICIEDDINDEDLDDEDELSDTAFETIYAPQHYRQTRLGSPIRTDTRLDNLDPIHRDVVEGFVREAKDKSKQLIIEHNLRTAPFSDTILREMAISFPRDEAELSRLPGIDLERVKLHGRIFLRLIDQSRKSYEQMMDESERPSDPNHRNVIDLISDDDMDPDNGRSAAAASKAVRMAEDEFDDETFDSSPGERSSYFRVPEEVREYNDRFKQLKQAEQKAKAPAQRQSRTTKQNGKGRSTGGTGVGKRKGSGARGSKGGGAFGEGASNGRAVKKGGVSTKKAAKKRSEAGVNMYGAGPSRMGAGGGGGGISAMPT